MRSRIFFLSLIIALLTSLSSFCQAEGLKLGFGLHGGYVSQLSNNSDYDYKYEYSYGGSCHFRIDEKAHFAINILSSSWSREDVYGADEWIRRREYTITNFEIIPSLRLYTAPDTNKFNILFNLGIGFIGITTNNDIDYIDNFDSDSESNTFYANAVLIAGVGIEYEVYKNINIEILPLYHLFDSSIYPDSNTGFLSVNLGIVAFF